MMHPYTMRKLHEAYVRKMYHEKYGNQSIHPRVVNGRTVHAKVNTAKTVKV